METTVSYTVIKLWKGECVMTTKERILDAALNLFAEKGYDGVGVDLIAEKAGLKGPSLYKHFKSKEEILSVLIDQVENYYSMNFGTENNPGQLPSTVDELIADSLTRIAFTLHDERIKKTRRILAKEQFRNERIAKLFTKYNMKNIQNMYQKIFEGMMDAGIMQKEDAKMLSMAFTAPISLLIQMCDREPERETEAMELIMRYMQFFKEKVSVK